MMRSIPLRGFDQECASKIVAHMEEHGTRFLRGCVPTRFEKLPSGQVRVTWSEGKEKAVGHEDFDTVLLAIGRYALTQQLNLDKIGVEVDIHSRKVINPPDAPGATVGDTEQSTCQHIFAVGDVAGPYQFTHTASHMAWYASVNALFGLFKKFKVDYSVIPWATFCSPEVARVGINEKEACTQNIPYEVSVYDVSDLDRSIVDEEAHGLVKVLTVPGGDKILGVTIAANHAGEIIGEFTLAMKHRIGLNKILGTIHIYPTFMEMNKFAASEWRKNHKPEWALILAEKFHRWRRGTPKEKSVV